MLEGGFDGGDDVDVGTETVEVDVVFGGGGTEVVVLHGQETLVEREFESRKKRTLGGGLFALGLFGKNNRMESDFGTVDVLVTTGVEPDFHSFEGVVGAIGLELGLEHDGFRVEGRAEDGGDDDLVEHGEGE